MSLKFKALGLGLIAALALSATAVMSATASTGGHFVSGNSHTMLSGTDSTTDQTEFTGIAAVKCSATKYEGTASETESQITITPTYGGCTYGSEQATVDMKGCDYLFTADSTPEVGHNTVHLVCPGSAGPSITISPGFGHCTITVTPNQTPAGGVVYTTDTVDGVHKIKADVTVQSIHSVYDGGFFACGVSNGHTTNSELHGTATLEGHSTAGARVPITVT